MADFDLKRFAEAQDRGGTYRRALEELQAERKASHWMWFVFPQLDGLGRSPTARAYAIFSLAEARAYLEHPVLGRACASAPTPYSASSTAGKKTRRPSRVCDKPAIRRQIADA